MKCEEIQGLILTDYADGEIGPETRPEIEEHIRICGTCRQLEEAMRRDAREPFKSVMKELPPAYIFERVKQAIASAPKDKNDILENVRALAGQIFLPFVKIPRPVVAFAAGAMVIVAIVIARPIGEIRAVDQYLGEQASFMASLDTADTNGEGMFDTYIKTGAEKFV